MAYSINLIEDNMRGHSMLNKILVITLTISALFVSSGYSFTDYKEANAEYSTKNIGLESTWKYAEYSKINDGKAVLYSPKDNKKGVTIAINAGHGTKGGERIKTLCHPDGSPKTTGGSTAKGASEATAVSAGMTFADGTSEAYISLEIAKYVRNLLIERGYNVLMLRDSEDVQLDNIARTVISNNVADCMISFHWDGDSLNYDKGIFYIKVPEQLREMEPVCDYWQKHDALGETIVDSLDDDGFKKYKDGYMSIDLTQTSYSEIPSVDIELGNQCSVHDDIVLRRMAESIVEGIEEFFK